MREMGETSPRLALEEKKNAELRERVCQLPKKSKDHANEQKSTSLCQDSSSFHIVCNGKHSLLYRPLYFGVKYWMYAHRIYYWARLSFGGERML